MFISPSIYHPRATTVLCTSCLPRRYYCMRAARRFKYLIVFRVYYYSHACSTTPAARATSGYPENKATEKPRSIRWSVAIQGRCQQWQAGIVLVQPLPGPSKTRHCRHARSMVRDYNIRGYGFPPLRISPPPKTTPHASAQLGKL